MDVFMLVAKIIATVVVVGLCMIGIVAATAPTVPECPAGQFPVRVEGNGLAWQAKFGCAVGQIKE